MPPCTTFVEAWRETANVFFTECSDIGARVAYHARCNEAVADVSTRRRLFADSYLRVLWPLTMTSPIKCASSCLRFPVAG